MGEFPQFNAQGKETIVDSAQDDDVESDEEVVRSGVQTSFKDLLVVKDWLKLHPEKVRQGLKTFKLWAPMFGGRLPYKSVVRKAAKNNFIDRKYQGPTDRSRSHMNYHRAQQKY